jgi:hypothetical protein
MSYDMSDYVDVAERIRVFKATHPEGSLQPWNPDKPYEIVQVGDRLFIVYTAAAYRTPDDPRPGIAVAWEPAFGKTNFTRDSELMNAETSAWGRAILAALAADSKRIASANEVMNRRADQESQPVQVVNNAPAPEKPAPKERKVEVGSAAKANSGSGKPSEKQVNFLKALMSQTGADADIVCALVGARDVDSLSWQQAKKAIDDLIRIKDGTAALMFDTEGNAYIK